MRGPLTTFNANSVVTKPGEKSNTWTCLKPDRDDKEGPLKHCNITFVLEINTSIRCQRVDRMFAGTTMHMSHKVMNRVATYLYAAR